MAESESVSCSVISDSLQTHGLEPVGLLCPWDSAGKNPGVGCQFSSLGDLSSPGIKPASRVSSVLAVRFFTTSASGHIVNQLCFSWFFFFN